MSTFASSENKPSPLLKHRRYQHQQQQHQQQQQQQDGKLKTTNANTTSSEILTPSPSNDARLRPQTTLREGNYEGDCPSCGNTLRFRATTADKTAPAATAAVAAAAVGRTTAAMPVLAETDVVVNFTVNGKAVREYC